MNFIDAVRTLRKERGIGFEEARDLVIEHFKNNNIPLPVVYQSLEDKRSAEVKEFTGKVGCEREDGTLNVHGEAEYCDVCRHLKPGGKV